MKKLISAALAILLLVGICIPFARAQNDSIFDVDIENNAEYDGYIFKTASEDAIETDMESSFTEIHSNVYQADSIEDIIENVEENDIEYIEPDYLMYLEETVEVEATNDPYYSNQWNLGMINVSSYWDSWLSGNGIIIGVIDSGLYTGHEDINYANVAVGKNLINGSRNTEDVLGHGTNVTGIISAVSNNKTGIAGIMDDVTIVPLKIFDENTTPMSCLVQAIYEAVDTYNCDVINMSLSASAGTQTLYEAVCYADANNVLMVAAVGNEYGTALRYPAAYDEVIGVGGVDSKKAMYAGSQRNKSVFITAPGEFVITLSSASRSGYVYTTGTSVAVPHITAAAAIARSYDPNMGLSEFKELLISSAVDKGVSGYDTSYGYGIIDLDLLIDNLMGIGRFIDPGGHEYRDVNPFGWAADSIYYVTERGLFVGTGATTFSPNTGMTRGMFVTVLGRLYESGGGTIPNTNNSFTDTANSAYYSKYVSWAAKNGLMYGYGNGKFGPNDKITREQMVAVLYRYAVFAKINTGTIDMNAFSKYSDASSVNSWAKTAMAWSVREGIIVGISGKLAPKQTATRAQVAAVFHRYVVRFIDG